MARSAAPISMMLPSARSRGTGTGTSWREPIATCDPLGSRRVSSAIMSLHSALVSASTWSITSTIGAPVAAIEDASRATSATPAPSDAKDRDTVGSIRWTRSSATGEIRQQHRRVVVAIVEGDPRPFGLAFRPLGQQRRLAVPGWSDDGDGREHAASEQPFDQSGTKHDAPAHSGRSFASSISNGGSRPARCAGADG